MVVDLPKANTNFSSPPGILFLGEMAVCNIHDVSRGVPKMLYAQNICISILS